MHQPLQVFRTLRRQLSQREWLIMEDIDAGAVGACGEKRMAPCQQLVTDGPTREQVTEGIRHAGAGELFRSGVPRGVLLVLQVETHDTEIADGGARGTVQGDSGGPQANVR